MLNLAMLIIIICLSLAWIRLYKTNHSLEQDVELLAKETGKIEVHNANKVYVRALKSLHPSGWRYRIYLPPSENFDFVIGKVSVSADQKIDFSRIDPKTISRFKSEYSGEFRLDLFVLNRGSQKPYLVFDVFPMKNDLRLGSWQSTDRTGAYLERFKLAPALLESVIDFPNDSNQLPMPDDFMFSNISEQFEFDTTEPIVLVLKSEYYSYDSQASNYEGDVFVAAIIPSDNNELSWDKYFYAKNKSERLKKDPNFAFPYK